jgi:hypothetical protein
LVSGLWFLGFAFFPALSSPGEMTGGQTQRFKIQNSKSQSIMIFFSSPAKYYSPYFLGRKMFSIIL